MAKKKNTTRALFEENSGRASSKTDISPVFETDVGVSWDDNSLGLGELFGDIPKTSGVSEESSLRKPSVQVPGAYGYTSGAADPNELSKFTNSPDSLMGRPGEKQDKDTTLLTKILGGSNPYPALEVPRLVTETNDKVKELEKEKANGTGEGENAGSGGNTDTGTTTTDLLSSLLDPNYGAQASEDVMGQYAAMTGGRPSSAAISAGTAAKVDAETALLQELLVSDTEDDGDVKNVLEQLLGTDGTKKDVPEEYAAYADLAGYETIVPMLESFESEEDMGDYLADMVNKGVISEAVATEYLKRFDDPYEEYDAGGRIDYASMVQNVGGWQMTGDGGTNFFGGLNRNMKIKAPNGQEFTVAQLYRLLKKNGMDETEAKNHLVKLQNYLKSKE